MVWTRGLPMLVYMKRRDIWTLTYLTELPDDKKQSYLERLWDCQAAVYYFTQAKEAIEEARDNYDLCDEDEVRITTFNSKPLTVVSKLQIVKEFL